MKLIELVKKWCLIKYNDQASNTSSRQKLFIYLLKTNKQIIFTKKQNQQLSQSPAPPPRITEKKNKKY